MADKTDISDAGNSQKRIFAEICSMAVEHGAVNLGQGFPDFGPPQHLLDALATVARSENALVHQYCRSFGHIRLVNVLSKLYSRFYQSSLDPLNNVLVTVGAYGGLVCAIESIAKPGDEILIFEPFFDCYKTMLENVGATPIFIPLHVLEKSTDIDAAFNSDKWIFTEEYLLSHIGPNTKAIVLNTPSNPLGKVFSQPELEIIRDMCIEFDLFCISDEVYEWQTFDDRRHIKISAMEGMWERTLTIGSAGKAFSATGWKTGWVIGPKNLIVNCQTIFQKCWYRCPTPIQEAVAMGIETELNRIESDECYFKSLARDLERKRNWLAETLNTIGMKPVIPGGGYFLLAEITTFKKHLSQQIVADDTKDDVADDIRFIKWTIKEKKFGAIPVSLFYSTQNREIGQKYIRICFAKKDSTLQAAVDILKHFQISKKDNLGNQV